jgi:hypothetical protein
MKTALYTEELLSHFPLSRFEHITVRYEPYRAGESPVFARLHLVCLLLFQSRRLLPHPAYS